MTRPVVVPDGLYVTDAPNLPTGYQIKCVLCGWSVDIEHEPGSADCIEGQRERMLRYEE